MKAFILTLTLSFVSFISFGQDLLQVAPGDWVYLESNGPYTYAGSISDNGLPGASFRDYIEIGEGEYLNPPTEGSYLTRYLFDLDDDLEYIYTGGDINNPYIEIIDTDSSNPGSTNSSKTYRGRLVEIVSTNEGSYILAFDAQGEPEAESAGGHLYRIPLPVYLPSFIPTDLQPKVITRTDTIYVERTTTQRDTVVIENLITRVDTVFLKEVTNSVDTIYNETRVYVEGNVDTVYNEIRVVEERVTRDTVYSVTRQERFTSDTVFIYRVDSLYLLGSDYLADLNQVTGVSSQPIVKRLSDPYPNPASATVSIDYVTATPSGNMFLGVYDSQGHRVGQYPVNVSGTITFEVGDWAPGVYVYMIWSPMGVSTTKKLVVE